MANSSRGSSYRLVFVCLVAFLAAIALAMTPTIVWGQSSTTGSVSGVVVDPSNAMVAGAKVTLTELSTNVTQSTVTDTTGRYEFAAVQPGQYKMTVSANGFKTNVITNIVVEVTKAYTYNVTLRVGTASQTVEVTSTPGAELQTSNASVGTALTGATLLRLPTIQRQVSSLLGLQPAVNPMTTSDVMGGQVAGAASDQTTFLVDGGDATSDMEGTNSYAALPGETEPAPFIQVPVETTQEFRVITADPTSSLNRSQGGQISIISKRGTNSIHGSAYEYYQGSALNANSWSNNRIGLKRPGVVNNRFGVTLGGPVIKNKLFLYGNYEGRRFRQSTSITTDVPTATARAGVLIFPDATGTPIAYNLNPTAVTVNGTTYPASTPCSTGAPCDPRQLGIDPTIAAYWNLEPLPNSPGTGDKYNSEAYVFNAPEPDNENYGMVRLDYTINNRWNLFSTYWQQKAVYYTNDQFTIVGGKPKLISDTPILPRFATFELTGTIGSSFTDQLHGSYMIDSWGWLRAPVVNPSGVTGLNGVLQVSGEGRTGGATAGKAFADPTNFNTQNARARYWGGHDWYLADDATWLHGTHAITFGGSWYFWNITHQRHDNVLGGLTDAQIYWVGSKHMSSGAYINTPSSQVPTVCTSSLLTNCIPSNSLTRWDSEYAAVLGLLDHSSQVITANNQFIPQSPGTPATDHVHMGSFYTYVGDSWKMKPSVTLTYGVSWGVQFPPKELSGLQVLQQYTSTGQPVQNINAYFAARQQALDRGNPYPSLNDLSNPSFEFSPIGTIPGYSRPVNTFWGSLGPHVAVAWQPQFDNKLFGNHQTVIRAGYALEWNRTNAVGMVLTPLLGDGLMQIVGCNGPDMTGTCTGSTKNDASNAYRIGIDGPGPALPPAVSGYPLVPASGFQSTYGFNLDPKMTPPWSHEFNADIQRTFAHNWLVDVGYIGRISRNLENGGDINASDMFAKDPVSGQTLAQAFDALSTWAQGGGSCTSNTNCPGLAVQPFFENMAAPGATGAGYCATTYGPGGSCTFAAANADQANGDAANGGLGSFMIDTYDFIAKSPLDPTQFVFNFWNWGGGWSNYNAGYISVRKAFSQGLDLGFNYTLSHTMGTQTLNQQYIIYGNASPFDPITGYAAEPFDRRNVFNAYAYYVLPFGRGKRFASENNIADRIIGGWYVSGIWTHASGQPVCIGADGDYGDIAGAAISGTCALTTMHLTASRNNNGPTGLNEFANPTTVYNQLSRPLPGVNMRPFQDTFTGFPTWNLDMSVGKNIVDTERMKAIFEADAFNVFNLMMPANSGRLDMNYPSSIFGEVTSQQNAPRTLQLGMRLEF
ncbi:MAG: carboxypeptidase-like regulatory domain-containing protein [Candidatus Acidiferrales bacterium]